MTKKITAIIAGVFWAMFGISFIFTGPAGGLTGPGVALYIVGILGGIGALVALAALVLIDYARRPR